MTDRSPRFLVVSGLSGAGRSTALKALEDMGYETVDNLPLALMPDLIGPRAHGPPLALGVSALNKELSAQAILAALDHLKSDAPRERKLLFLDCDDDRLAQRYAETRHRHPMAGDRPVADGIALERRLVAPLRERADLVIDTTASTPGDLKRVLHGHFALEAEPGLAIFVTSFSFRHGLPRDADMVLDVRFLRNPYYLSDLEPLTGRTRAVGSYIEADPDFQTFFDGLCAWLAPLLPRYEGEGKSYFTIAIGCTGGRHRSVYVANRLTAWLTQQACRATVTHRDLDGFA